jgi:hypothetical protein
MNKGWIKIHRKITEWEWYTDTNTFALFMHLMLTCNFKETKWRGIQLEAGETIKSIKTLAEETHLSVRNVRTSIKRLKSTREVTQRRHGKHRILKVKSYTDYQLSDKESDNEVTRKRHDSDTRVRKKEGKKEKKLYISKAKLSKTFSHDFELIKLTNEEVVKLVDKFGDRLAELLIDFENSLGSKGYKYKSHYRAMLKWYDKPKTPEFYSKEMEKLGFAGFANKYGLDKATEITKQI